MCMDDNSRNSPSLSSVSGSRAGETDRGGGARRVPNLLGYRWLSIVLDPNDAGCDVSPFQSCQDVVHSVVVTLGEHKRMSRR